MNWRRKHRTSRDGAAFLMLVVVLLLVVAGATKSLVQSELARRRGEADRMRLQTMQSAIAAAQNLPADSTELKSGIRFPVDPSTNQSILVSISEDQSTLVAAWYHNDRVIDEMTRPTEEKNTESAE